MDLLFPMPEAPDTRFILKDYGQQQFPRNPLNSGLAGISRRKLATTNEMFLTSKAVEGISNDINEVFPQTIPTQSIGIN